MKYLYPVFLYSLIVLFALGCKPDTSHNGTVVHKNSTSNLQMEYELHYCEWTGDKIETVRYGAQVNNGDETYNFKSVECAVAWQLAMNNSADSSNLLVVDFVDGKKLIPAEDAIYLHSTLRPSPGKLFISALEKTNTFMQGRVYEAYPGKFLEWDELVDLVKKEWGSSPDSPKATL